MCMMNEVFAAQHFQATHQGKVTCYKVVKQVPIIDTLGRTIGYSLRSLFHDEFKWVVGENVSTYQGECPSQDGEVREGIHVHLTFQGARRYRVDSDEVIIVVECDVADLIGYERVNDNYPGLDQLAFQKVTLSQAEYNKAIS